MTFQPLFVPGGVYLRTSTGELIGRLDDPGAPFETLHDARIAADWLEMVLQFRPAKRRRKLVGASRTSDRATIQKNAKAPPDKTAELTGAVAFRTT